MRLNIEEFNLKVYNNKVEENVEISEIIVKLIRLIIMRQSKPQKLNEKCKVALKV